MPNRRNAPRGVNPPAAVPEAPVPPVADPMNVLAQILAAQQQQQIVAQQQQAVRDEFLQQQQIVAQQQQAQLHNTVSS